MADRSPRPWVPAVLFVPAAIALVACYALLAGQDINWDSRNYHFYLPWALLEGRLETDFEAAGVQTFLNPVVYLPYHLLVTSLPPRAAAAGLAALQALSLLPVYLIALHFLPAGPARSRHALALLATLTGGTAPFYLSEAGTSFADNLVSLPLLAAVWIAGRGLDARRSTGTGPMLLAGALVGAAAGLKLTGMVYVIGFLVAVAVAAPLREKGRLILAATAGMVAGWVVTGGAWAWRLWSTWQSPVFPFFNDIFRSPLYTGHRAADARFLPGSPAEALSYPFQWAVGGHPSAEIPFRDARFAIILGLAAAVLIGMAVRLVTGRRKHEAGRPGIDRPEVRRGEIFLMVFFGASGVVWLNRFAIHRYIVTLELLSGVVLALLCARAFGRSRPARAAAVLLLLAVIAWGRPASYDRVTWDDSWFGVEPTPALTRPGTLFLLFGYDPVAFVAPFLPSSARLVRLTGSVGIGMPMGHQAVEIVGAHDGPLRTLSEGELRPEPKAVLAQLGLAIEPGSCEPLPTRAATLQSCAVRKIPASLSQPAGSQPLSPAPGGAR